jgi:hypothetical protein
MAKPTPVQNYFLFIIAWMRWFGPVFAAVAILITASNLPWLLRSNDLKLLSVIWLGEPSSFWLVWWSIGS